MQNKYRVINGDIKDDTGYHTKGDIVLMNEEQAAPLLAVNHLEPLAQDTMTAHATPQQMVAAPDGFPDRKLDSKESETPPAGEQIPPALNAPAVQTIAQPANGQIQATPKQPTEEQIARDMESIA